MYLELSDLHDFFRQCLLYNKLVGKLKKSRLFPPSGPPSTSTTATWWSPTSEFVIKVNLTYYTCFMPNFSQGIHLDGSQTCQTLLEHPHRRRQPQPGGPLQASSSSKSTSHIIHVLYLFFHKESIKMGPRHVRPF